MRPLVLIVDDEETLRLLLQQFFARGPYRVRTAANAAEALAVAERQPVDVVIADQEMPGMKGTQLLTEIAARSPDSVRIILTGHGTLDVAVRAINEGRIYRFFTKPCDLKELHAAVVQGLAERRPPTPDSAEAPAEPSSPAPDIRELERRHPGITRVKRDADGAIIIDDE